MPTMLVSTSCESVVSNTSQLSSSSQSPHHKPLLLMLPPDYTTYNPSADSTLRNEWDTYMYSQDDDDRKPCCIGSSKGWMILREANYETNGEYCLFLFNPFCQKARKIVVPNERPTNFAIRNIRKAIPVMHTFQPGYKFGVVVMYGLLSKKVALLMVHDEQDQENKWMNLDFSNVEYEDVVCNKQYLFALSSRSSVEIWDLRSIKIDGSVNKTVDTGRLSLQSDHVAEGRDENRELYSSKVYLIESQGTLLMVMRFIGEFVREDGEVVTEGDLLGDEYYSHIVAPYKTKNFYVYKLDLGLKEWARVESLGDQVLFLGLNQSLSLKASDQCQANLIHFTDDYWEHIDMLENELYGGHDIGIFNLADRSVKEIVEVKRMVPPPLWVEQDNSHL